MPAKPKLGQNLLNDSQAIQRIAAALRDIAGQTIIEIGPGQGAITRALAARAAHVLAIELDHHFAISMRANFPPDRVTVIEQDVLNFDFAAASNTAGRPLPLAGNLPYYITSPILMHLFTQHEHIEQIVIMVQREVADRVVATPGSRDYGLLSVTVQMYGPAELLFTLPPSAFTPPPDVHSAVFRWRFAPRFAELGVEESTFFKFVRQVFAQKRKTLANNLRAAGFTPAHIQAAIAIASIAPLARAEALSLETLALLWKSLEAERAATSTVATPQVSI